MLFYFVVETHRGIIESNKGNKTLLLLMFYLFTSGILLCVAGARYSSECIRANFHKNHVVN